MNHKLNKRKTGFSLLEMAIVLGIMSMLLGGLYTVLPAQIQSTNINNTKASLDFIQNAIDSYVNQFGKLPCPAPLTTAPDTANFGISADCTAAVPGGITSVGTSTDIIWIGGLPTRTLNISDRYAVDAWNNRIQYTIVKGMATALITGYSSATAGHIIRIIDANGNSVNLANTPISNPNVVAYTLVSFGQGSAGARNYPGNAIVTACPNSGLEQQNCSNTNTFRDMSVNSQNYFTQFVRWKTQNQLARDSNYQVTGGGSLTNYALKVGIFAEQAAAPCSVAAFSHIPIGSSNNRFDDAGNKRRLNVTQANTLSGSVSLSSSSVTLPAGTYLIEGAASMNPTQNTGAKLAIYNDTTSSIMAQSVMVWTPNNNLHNSTVTAFVTFATTTSISLRVNSGSNTTIGTWGSFACNSASATQDGTPIGATLKVIQQ